MAETDILQRIVSEAGMVALILAIGCGVAYRAYCMERKERQMLQKALTDLVHETNEVLTKIHLLLTSINERLR